MPPRACGGGSGSTRATDRVVARLGPSPPSAAPADPSGSAGRADPSVPRRRLDLAALRIDRAGPRSSAGGDEPLAIRARSPSRARPQPGDARRRVARPALVVAVAATAGSRSPARAHRAAAPGRHPPRSRPIGIAMVGREAADAAALDRPAPAWPARGDLRVGSPDRGLPGLVEHRLRAAGSPRRRRRSGISREPAERPRRIRVRRLRRLAPRRHLPDERHALVELAHPVDEAALLGLGRGAPPRPAPLRPGRRKNSAKPPSASRSRRTMTESYVSSAFATRSTSGRGNPSATPTSRTADRAR